MFCLAILFFCMILMKKTINWPTYFGSLRSQLNNVTLHSLTRSFLTNIFRKKHHFYAYIVKLYKKWLARLNRFLNLYNYLGYVMIIYSFVWVFLELFCCSLCTNIVDIFGLPRLHYYYKRITYINILIVYLNYRHSMIFLY